MLLCVWLVRGGRVPHSELGAETRGRAAVIPPEDPHPWELHLREGPASKRLLGLLPTSSGFIKKQSLQLQQEPVAATGAAVQDVPGSRGRWQLHCQLLQLVRGAGAAAPRAAP